MKSLTSRDYAVLYLRLAVGLMLFVLHGWARIGRLYEYLVLRHSWTFVGLVQRIGFPAAPAFAVAAALAESLGALMVIAGLFTRWAAAVIAINMAVAVYFEWKKGEGGAELPGMYLVAIVAVLLAGSGPCSLDAIRKGRSRKRGSR